MLEFIKMLTKKEKILFFMINLGLYYNSIEPIETRVSTILLTSKSINFLTEFFIINNTITCLNKSKKELNNLLYDSTRYEFEGNRYNIKELMNIEQAILEESIITNNIYQRWKKTRVLLTVLQQHFIVIIQPFIDIARNIHMQKHFLYLIEEECIKRNRPHSFLLEWIKLEIPQNGNINEIFKYRVNIFKKFYQFCLDWIDFLTDLEHSCVNNMDIQVINYTT